MAYYEGHALDEITFDGTFRSARTAAEAARAIGAVAAIQEIIENGVKVAEVSVEVISRGPAYRVKDTSIVIVLAGFPGRYTSHAAPESIESVALDAWAGVR